VFSYQERTTLQKDDDHEFDIVSACFLLHCFNSLSHLIGFLLSSIVMVLGSLGNAILLTHMNTSRSW
jgi:hypothetical protein